MPDHTRTRLASRRLTGAVLALGVGLGVVAVSCGDDDASELDLSPLAAEGRSLVETEGCAACHGADGRGTIGPSWAGLPGGEVELDDGSTVVADEAYLRRAILDPEADVRRGFELRMPDNSLTEAEADAVIAYMKELP